MDTSSVKTDHVNGKYYIEYEGMNIPFVPLATNKAFPPLTPQRKTNDDC